MIENLMKSLKYIDKSGVEYKESKIHLYLFIYSLISVLDVGNITDPCLRNLIGGGVCFCMRS